MQSLDPELMRLLELAAFGEGGQRQLMSRAIELRMEFLDPGLDNVRDQLRVLTAKLADPAVSDEDVRIAVLVVFWEVGWRASETPFDEPAWTINAACSIAGAPSGGRAHFIRVLDEGALRRLELALPRRGFSHLESTGLVREIAGLVEELLASSPEDPFPTPREYEASARVFRALGRVLAADERRRTQ